MTILVTGGAGFIGSNFIIDWFQNSDEQIINVDKITYSGNLANLDGLSPKDNYYFIKADICDFETMGQILAKYKVRGVINFAAESHVDRSINGPGQFIKTNIIGTYQLLEAVRDYWSILKNDYAQNFRFIHVSTDEVYGSLEKKDEPFTEKKTYEPNSPYAATKASSDHLIRAWHQTYDLPVITTNCSNNYGPFQFPEKLIPLIIVNALNAKPLPIYGDGLQIRDWLFVKDHTAAIREVFEKGVVGETYNIGGDNEKTNVFIVKKICEILDVIAPAKNKKEYEELIKFVDDRPGHDRRYAINSSKIQKELNWRPKESFETGIQKTIEWYLNNLKWIQTVTNNEYKSWINHQYGQLN